jgi:hypothetical protein
MDARARVFIAQWNRRTRLVNLRLLFLFVVMFVAIGFFAYRGESTDARIRASNYQACLDRVAQFSSYNLNVPAAVARIVDLGDPALEPGARARLVADLTARLQVPPPVCVPQ